MTSNKQDRAPGEARLRETASHLDMTAEQREAAKAHAAMLSETAARVAVELPLTADVDDFRRVLAERAAQ
jgi:hypothetical protein